MELGYMRKVVFSIPDLYYNYYCNNILWKIKVVNKT